MSMNHVTSASKGDIALVVLVAFVSIPPLVRNGGVSVIDGLLVAALSLPLLVRRRYPLEAFAVIAAMALLQWVTNARYLSDISLLVAFYTVASIEGPRKRVIAATVLEIGIVLAVLRWGDGHWLLMVLLSGMATAAGVLGVYARTHRAYLAQLEERAARLERERDQQGQLSAAAERARIAREMHDIVAHHLAVMIALSDGAAATARTSPERAARAMQSVSATGRSALADTRRLLGVLREDIETTSRSPLPDTSGLDELIERMRTAGVDTEFTVDGDPLIVPMALQLTIYRIVQESLTNTLKHAGPAARAQVRLTYRHEEILVEISDDGMGNAGHERGRGHGINGMRERVGPWHGELRCGPRQPHGWRVQVNLPRESSPVPAS
jgi:signal transduction histidine kinase